MAKATIAVIVGNRDFFPDRLVTEARTGHPGAVQGDGHRAGHPGRERHQTRRGGDVGARQALRRAVQASTASASTASWSRCPTSATRRAWPIRSGSSGLNVPILVQAYPDDLNAAVRSSGGATAFCGKISVCNNLRQYGYRLHADRAAHGAPAHARASSADLRRFVGVCRVVKGLRRARLGAVGARPDAFKTVRYSEKLLQAYGISVSTIDLSEIFGAANKLADDDASVCAPSWRRSAPMPRTDGVPAPSLVKMAKLAIVLRRLDGRERPERHARCSAGTRSRRTTASTSAR